MQSTRTLLAPVTCKPVIRGPLHTRTCPRPRAAAGRVGGKEAQQQAGRLCRHVVVARLQGGKDAAGAPRSADDGSHAHHAAARLLPSVDCWGGGQVGTQACEGERVGQHCKAWQ